MQSLIRRVSVPESRRGADDSLDAILHEVREPVGVAVVAHPHPSFGGTMGNRVVAHVARALAAANVLTLRFNYRGVGGSGGEYGGIPGAADDVARAAAHVATLAPASRAPAPAPPPAPALPLVLAGFSFGALAVAHAIPRVRPRAAALIGLPYAGGDADLDAHRDVSFLAASETHLIAVSGEVDEFGPGDSLAKHLAAAGVTARVHVVAGEGHFFENRVEEAADVVAAFLHTCL